MQYSFEYFTNAAKAAVECAVKSAGMMGHTYVGSEHLLLGIASTEQSVGSKILRLRGITARDIIGVIEDVIGSGNPTVLGYDNFTQKAHIIIENSIKYMRQKCCTCVGTDHLLLSVVNGTDSFAKKLLKELDVNITTLISELEDYRVHTASDNLCKNTNSSKQSKSALLEKYGKNLTLAALNGELDPLVGRKAEINKVIRVLCRRHKNNPCLVGEPGVGKTAIAEGLAVMIANNNVPDLLLGKQIISLDLTALVAGTKYRGDFEDRVMCLVNEARQNKDVILFIDEIHTVVGAGSAEGSVDAANMLKPALTKGDFRVIGATTYSEYRKNIEKDSALERRFQPIYVNEPSCTEAIDIIKGISEIYSRHHNIIISEEVITAAVMLSSRYINERFLPDKAIDVIDEAAAKVRLEQKVSVNGEAEQLEFNKGEEYTFDSGVVCCTRTAACSRTAQLTVEDIKEVIAENCNIPATQLTGNLLYKDPFEKLSKTVVGQSEAVKAVCDTLRRSAVGVRDKRRPIGSFLFCGPTGVGKTYLCNCIAKELFGSVKNLVKLDMSEYSQKHTVSRLIGAPPGYVGFDEPGQLTEPVRKNPYCVVLFDEIEKAHPDIYNILLQILEDGVLTDAAGRRVSFTNTVVIMTSNVGANKGGALGFNSVPQDKIKNEIVKLFSPELLGRIDDTVVFSPLGREELEKICGLMLCDFTSIVEENGGSIELSRDLPKFLVSKCNEGDNARTLRKIIRNNVEDKFCSFALECGGIAGGKFVCKVNNNDIVVAKSK